MNKKRIFERLDDEFGQYTQGKDEVIFRPKGSHSKRITHLFKRFSDLVKERKMLAEQEKTMNDEIKQLFNETFDEADKFATRVIETASGFVSKLSKQTEKDIEKFDQKRYIETLEKMTGLSVDALKEIRQQLTTIEKSVTPSRLLAPSTQSAPSGGTTANQPETKRRGRPVGSKNRPKSLNDSVMVDEGLDSDYEMLDNKLSNKIATFSDSWQSQMDKLDKKMFG